METLFVLITLNLFLLVLIIYLNIKERKRTKKMETKETKDIKEALALYTQQHKGSYGACEVTVGYAGGRKDYERCDYVEFNSNSEIVCYEIKVTFEDFLSNNKQTYLGDRNYLVVTKELLKQIEQRRDYIREKGKLQSGIGIIVYNDNGLRIYKKCSKHSVPISQRVQLLEGIARAGCRDANKFYLVNSINK